jgi:catechol 2,3-dioxygenase-like lactoylglutathione lyase family enzyme
MLKDSNVYAVLAVKDLEKAKDFYETKLGLKHDSEDPGGVFYESGDSKLFVYESDYAGTNKATAATWQVDDIEAVVEDLKSKGISFEHYDMPGATREGDIHIIGELKAAWFKDPDGNILNVAS